MSALSNDRPWGEPFDMDAFLNAADAKVFYPDETLTIDLTDEEWERFNQAIRDGREVDDHRDSPVSIRKLSTL